MGPASQSVRATEPSPIDRAVLRDGSVVHVRPIAPADKQALQKAFERLSPESRFRRFLTPLKKLSNVELRYLTEVDHHDHEALVAVEPDHGEAVGVARFVRLEESPQTAEVAVAVLDDWHGRGVATVLLQQLVGRARLEGISRFRAICLADNREAIELLETLGRTEVDHRDPGLADLTIDLPQEMDGSASVHSALRHAARGGLGVYGEHHALSAERRQR